MDGRLCGHGMKESDIVDTGSNVWKQVGNHLPALAIGLEIPLGSDNAAFASLATASKCFYIDRFAV